MKYQAAALMAHMHQSFYLGMHCVTNWLAGTNILTFDLFLEKYVFCVSVTRQIEAHSLRRRNQNFYVQILLNLIELTIKDTRSAMPPKGRRLRPPVRNWL
jgi:hypothetical protein